MEEHIKMQCPELCGLHCNKERFLDMYEVCEQGCKKGYTDGKWKMTYGRTDW